MVPGCENGWFIHGVGKAALVPRVGQGEQPGIPARRLEHGGPLVPSHPPMLPGRRARLARVRMSVGLAGVGAAA